MVRVLGYGKDTPEHPEVMYATSTARMDDIMCAWCILFSSQVIRTGAHMTVPRTFSPGVQAFLSSVPGIPRGLFLGLACQSAILAGSNQPQRLQSTSLAGSRTELFPPSLHLSPTDVRFEVDGSSCFSFLFLWRSEDLSPSTSQLPSPTTDLR